MTDAVRLTSIRKSFGSQEVLCGVDLVVSPGEHVVVFGPSGSGKSTLLRTINLLERPTSGSVCVFGTEYGPGLPGATERRGAVIELRRQVGMVFQQFNLFPHKTALQNVIEAPMTVKGMSKADAIALGERLLDRVGLADKRDEYPSRLSGGQQQRVAIARALAMEPEVVLFDEPTSSLDPELHEEVLQTMRELARDGMTMVVVTHEVQFAKDVADRIVFMDGGVIVEEAPPAEFFTRPRHARARLFLRMVSGDGQSDSPEKHPNATEGTAAEL